MSDAPQETLVEAADRNGSVRRIWADILVGFTVFLWLGTFVLFALSHYVDGGVVVGGLTAAAMMSIICAVVFVAASSHRAAERRHAAAMLLMGGQNEQLVRDIRDLQGQVRGLSECLNAIQRSLPEIVRQVKWQGYTEASEDLAQQEASEDLAQQVVPMRRARTATGDLSGQSPTSGRS